MTRSTPASRFDRGLARAAALPPARSPRRRRVELGRSSSLRRRGCGSRSTKHDGEARIAQRGGRLQQQPTKPSSGGALEVRVAPPTQTGARIPSVSLSPTAAAQRRSRATRVALRGCHGSGSHQPTTRTYIRTVFPHGARALRRCLVRVCVPGHQACTGRRPIDRLGRFLGLRARSWRVSAQAGSPISR
jgi:hypothetical protein